MQIADPFVIVLVAQPVKVRLQGAVEKASGEVWTVSVNWSFTVRFSRSILPLVWGWLRIEKMCLIPRLFR